MDVYNRQSTLSLQIPRSVAIIGCGGVGAWVALDMALTGAKKIVLIDHDIIEGSNLNRTPFTTCQVGEPKVCAMSYLITERRPDCNVYPIQNRIELLTAFEKTILDDVEIIIDCRDTADELPVEYARKVAKIVGGYDGKSITLHLNRRSNTIWDGIHEETRYRIIPSWLAPPQMIAAIITEVICSRKYLDMNEETVISFNMDDIIEILKRGSEMRA